MNIDDLADLLKSRDCEAVCYFHTDHFEPWSTSIGISTFFSPQGYIRFVFFILPCH